MELAFVRACACMCVCMGSVGHGTSAVSCAYSSLIMAALWLQQVHEKS